MEATAIEVTPATGAGDALAYANDLVDPGSPITVDSANFNIDAVGGGTVQSELRAIAKFQNGNTGGQLPEDNWLNPQTPILYAGGIGIDVGVCLCTGLVTDDDVASEDAVDDSGVGLQGPNNGFPLSQLLDPGSQILNAGEVSFVNNKPRDQDFVEQVKSIQPEFEGDAAVLQLGVTLSSPGFLRMSFIIATDEHRYWLQLAEFDVNDSIGIFVRKNEVSCPGEAFENFARLITHSNPDPGGPMSLGELRDCAEPIFFDNQVVPGPDVELIPGVVGKFIESLHGFDDNLDGENRPNDGVPYYNHEYGGFTRKLTRETRCPLTPGKYVIKIVVQDVFDRKVDSAIFLENGSLKLYALVPGDYNLDGTVDGDDYAIWSANFGQTNASFCQGNGNNDCVVSAADYSVWRDHEGQMGNANYRSDFNRDGNVDNTDVLIMSPFFANVSQCASRFEGDTNRDGVVNSTDLANLEHDGENLPVVEQCGEVCCPSCDQEAMGGGGGETAAEMQMPPPSADVDGDGDLDEKDLAILDWIILGKGEFTYSTSTSPGESDATSAPLPDVDGDGDSDQDDLALIEALMQEQQQGAVSSSDDASPSPAEVEPTQNANAPSSDDLPEGFGPPPPWEEFPDPLRSDPVRP